MACPRSAVMGYPLDALTSQVHRRSRTRPAVRARKATASVSLHSRVSHESDSAARRRNMLKSLRVDIPPVGASMPAIGFVRQPHSARYGLCLPSGDTHMYVSLGSSEEQPLVKRCDIEAALGRRSADCTGTISDRHARRTHDTLHDADPPSTREGSRRNRAREERTRACRQRGGHDEERSRSDDDDVA